MLYKEALWGYLILGLIALGFDIAVIKNAAKITAYTLGLRITFVGKMCTRFVLLWFTWKATSYPASQLTWQYYVATLAAVLAIMGMALWTWETHHVNYGRRRDDR